ncbi:efflux RND transporter periplasmic adaptor subunit [Nitrosomonas sp.]|jgi:multidrug efflux system membrane fusion protein|uniref:efflux RND transporter periplasmic adaptor subunit n=1 Tax=Nitrosomonas sp. TaxID=42353 RepID=UPI002731A00C|nr:efflux RND transporter periplasmic adaptor subunit [Nitrosomonas sp.]MDP1786441.1 efflux RND transporter periplasmic adaptor subunit [Nitrosomonas sp.]MDP2225724.1 efflux RND transporter periplasmic adaptor subunit [Nitrosomonas sp.]
MNIHRQLLIALTIAIAGGLAALAIINSPPQTEQQEDIVKPPAVQVVTVKPERLRMDVRSQGRVMAQTEIDLITGVSGNIIKVSPVFVSGGFFKQGDLLVAIDPAEYDLRVAQAQAGVMEAQYQLIREEAEAEQARDEWQHLGQGEANPLSLRIPQLREKKARLAAEQEELKNAKLLRQRADIRAPFNGRVRNKTVGLGQYLSSGDVLGRIYSSDVAEVRLPLSTQELAFVGFPDLSNRTQSAQGTAVKLTANYQGQQQTWLGHIVRSEGVIDQETGMVMVVAQIPDPFGLGAKKPGTPDSKSPVAILPVGLYVEANIEGSWFDNLTVLPASALLRNNQAAVLDQDNRLRFRTVEVVRKEREQVIIKAGLNAGERVLVSGLHHPIEGIEVIPTEFVP